MRPKLVKIIRPDGKIFQFGDVFGETEILGAGTMHREIYSEPKGVGHGNYQTGSRIPPREIIISSTAFAKDDGEARASADDFFCYPEEDHRLEITYKGRTRWIMGQIEVFDLPIDSVGARQRFELSVLCLDPLFRSMDRFGKDIAQVTGAWGFPIFSSLDTIDPFVTGGNIAGVYDFSRKAFLKNDGDFMTYPVLAITTAGTVKNLKISKNTDEYILINDTLAKNDRLYIDFGEEILLKNEKNINRMIDRRSTYFGIDRGGCEIQYAAEQGENDLRMHIYYDQLYKGA